MNTTPATVNEQGARPSRRSRMRSFQATPENDKWLTLLQRRHVKISGVINDALRVHCVKVLRLWRRSKNPTVKALVASMKEAE